MNAERLKQVEEIYHAALKIAPEKREAFLKEFHGADEDLRREIESLLDSEKTFVNSSELPFAPLSAPHFSGQETNLVEKNIGHYKIKKLLGRGGMGDVYLAEDTRLNRRVALKFLSASFSKDKDRLRRFKREAFAASALNHPSILTIYEFCEEKGTYFLAAELIEGETLRDLLNNRNLNLNKILNITQQTAFALAAAHKSGITHRDIKPENIMVREEDGIVKVLDFGLAKLTSSEIPAPFPGINPEAETRALVKTIPGLVMGTAAYMSPEQTRGLADIDARTDIWSLGVVIFEMVTGRVPFAGETVSDIIASILKTETPHLSKCSDGCPAELERIVTKTLRKDREERYQVIKDLALDLKSLRRELEFSAEFDRFTDGAERNLTVEIPKQTTTFENAKRFSLSSALLILVCAGLLFGGGWWFFGGTNKNSETPTAVAFKTVEIANWAAASGEFYSAGTFSPDGKMIAFTSTKTGAKNIWIKQTASGEPIQITKDEFKNESPIWSPDGERLAFFSTRGKQYGIWQMPIFGGSPKLIAAIEDGSARLRFWSKKDLIYYESNSNLFAIDVNSGQSEQITDFDSKAVKAESINFSPDEQQIAYTTVDGEIWSVWTKSLTSEAPKKLVSAAAEIKNTIWHPDNNRILYSSPADGTFQIFVTDTSAAAPKQITFAERDVFALDVSSDGAKILYGSAKEESDIWGVNLKDSKEFTVASDIDSELWANVSPDGKTIAYQSIKNLSQGSNLSNGTILTKTLNSDDPPNEVVNDGFSPVWSPDGQQIAFMRVIGEKYQIETIKATGGGQKNLTAGGITPIFYTILPYNRIQTSDFSWSPDSTRIAYISNRSGQRNIWLVNADGSGDVQLTDNNDKDIGFSCPLWSSDGKRIAFISKTSEGKPAFGVWITDTDTKKSEMVIQPGSFLGLIGWSQNDKDLILTSVSNPSAAGLQPEVILLQISIMTGEKRQITKLENTYLYNIRLSPDKKNIAFAAHREDKDNIWLMPAAGGGEAKKLTANNDSRLYFSSLAWSPAGDSVFFGKQSRYSLLSTLTNFK